MAYDPNEHKSVMQQAADAVQKVETKAGHALAGAAPSVEDMALRGVAHATELMTGLKGAVAAVDAHEGVANNPLTEAIKDGGKKVDMMIGHATDKVETLGNAFNNPATQVGAVTPPQQTAPNLAVLTSGPALASLPRLPTPRIR